MNDEGIPTPNEYNRLKSTDKPHYVPMETMPLWTVDIIRRILQDERYTVNMVCGKYTSVKRKTILLPKEEWIITPNTHQAIVSDEVFKAAQAIFRTRKEIIMPAEPKSVQLEYSNVVAVKSLWCLRADTGESFTAIISTWVLIASMQKAMKLF